LDDLVFQPLQEIQYNTFRSILIHVYLLTPVHKISSL